jgi:LCP family protein required for cell wall assembly
MGQQLPGAFGQPPLLGQPAPDAPVPAPPLAAALPPLPPAPMALPPLGAAPMALPPLAAAPPPAGPPPEAPPPFGPVPEAPPPFGPVPTSLGAALRASEAMISGRTPESPADVPGTPDWGPARIPGEAAPASPAAAHSGGIYGGTPPSDGGTGAGTPPKPPGARRKRLRNPRWAKPAIFLGSVIAILSLVAVVGTQALAWWATAKIPTENLLPDDERPQGGNAQSIAGPLNILLLGMDKRDGNTDDLIRTDTVIVVHVNATHDEMSLISLPRDTEVDAPPFPDSNYPGGRQKLTEVFAMGNRKADASGHYHGDDSAAGRTRGVTLLARTIDSIVPGGLKFNAVAIINFDGFQKLVDALGGVTLCIDERVVSKQMTKDGRNVGDTGGGPNAKVYNRGCPHLQAWEALDYVRQRYYMELNDGDYGRQRHQQQFLLAVFKELLSRNTLTDVGKFGQLRDAAGQLLTLDLGGTGVADWLFSMRGINTGDITMVKTNGGNYATKVINGQDFEELVPDSVAMLQAVHDDSLDSFLAQHPSWVSRSDGT